MTPFYESDRALIWCGDCREILRYWTEPVSTIIVDPPHMGADYLEDLKAGARAWNAADMSSWMTYQLEFFHAFLPPCHQMVQAGPMWIHVPIHTMFPLQSVAYWDRWLAQRAWQLSAEEALLCLCQAGTINPAASMQIQTSRDLNRYNAPKPLDWLSVLLSLSPEGPVFDPMMGAGSTLVAAATIGRRAIGIEIREDLCRQTVDRLEALPHDSVPV